MAQLTPDQLYSLEHPEVTEPPPDVPTPGAPAAVAAPTDDPRLTPEQNAALNAPQIEEQQQAAAAAAANKQAQNEPWTDYLLATGGGAEQTVSNVASNVAKLPYMGWVNYAQPYIAPSASVQKLMKEHPYFAAAGNIAGGVALTIPASMLAEATAAGIAPEAAIGLWRAFGPGMQYAIRSGLSGGLNNLMTGDPNQSAARRFTTGAATGFGAGAVGRYAASAHPILEKGLGYALGGTGAAAGAYAGTGGAAAVTNLGHLLQIYGPKALLAAGAIAATRYAGANLGPRTLGAIAGSPVLSDPTGEWAQGTYRRAVNPPPQPQ